jgi:hypothetical protein
MFFAYIQTVNSNEKIEVHTMKKNAWISSPILATIKCFHILLDDIFSVPLLQHTKLGRPRMTHHMGLLLN